MVHFRPLFPLAIAFRVTHALFVFFLRFLTRSTFQELFIWIQTALITGVFSYFLSTIRSQELVSLKKPYVQQTFPTGVSLVLSPHYLYTKMQHWKCSAFAMRSVPTEVHIQEVLMWSAAMYLLPGMSVYINETVSMTSDRSRKIDWTQPICNHLTKLTNFSQIK